MTECILCRTNALCHELALCDVLLQGGEDAYSPLFSQVISRKRALSVMAFVAERDLQLIPHPLLQGGEDV